MKPYSHLTVNQLIVRARDYNSKSAVQQAQGVTPVWDRPANWLEEVLDELETRIGPEAVDAFRGILAEEHATLVAAYSPSTPPR